MDPITNGMRPIHPGEVLREEFLVPLGITPHALALELQVSAPRINDIVRECRAVTADTALRLAAFFGTSAEFWMGLQSDHDVTVARLAGRDALARIRPFVQAATPEAVTVPCPASAGARPMGIHQRSAVTDDDCCRSSAQ